MKTPLTREQFWQTLTTTQRSFLTELGRRLGPLEFLGAWKR